MASVVYILGNIWTNGMERHPPGVLKKTLSVETPGRSLQQGARVQAVKAHQAPERPLQFLIRCCFSVAHDRRAKIQQASTLMRYNHEPRASLLPEVHHHELVVAATVLCPGGKFVDLVARDLSRLFVRCRSKIRPPIAATRCWKRLHSSRASGRTFRAVAARRTTRRRSCEPGRRDGVTILIAYSGSKSPTIDTLLVDPRRETARVHRSRGTPLFAKATWVFGTPGNVAAEEMIPFSAT